MVGGVLIGGSWVKAVGPLLDHHSLKLDTCSTRTQKCVPPSRAERKLDSFFFLPSALVWDVPHKRSLGEL